MGNPSKRSSAQKINGGKGGRPLVYCQECSSIPLNNSLISPSSITNTVIHQFSGLNVEYNEYNRVILEDIEDEEIIFEENSIDYELSLCENFNSLLLEININNTLIFKNNENTFNGATSNFGINWGSGKSKTTLYENKKKVERLANSAVGCKRIEAYGFTSVVDNNGYNTDEDMQLAANANENNNNENNINNLNEVITIYLRFVIIVPK